MNHHWVTSGDRGTRLLQRLVVPPSDDGFLFQLIGNIDGSVFLQETPEHGLIALTASQAASMTPRQGDGRGPAVSAVHISLEFENALRVVLGYAETRLLEGLILDFGDEDIGYLISGFLWERAEATVMLPATAVFELTMDGEHLTTVREPWLLPLGFESETMASAYRRRYGV